MMDISQLSDAELLSRVAAGDAAAFIFHQMVSRELSRNTKYLKEG